MFSRVKVIVKHVNTAIGSFIFGQLSTISKRKVSGLQTDNPECSERVTNIQKFTDFISILAQSKRQTRNTYLTQGRV